MKRMYEFILKDHFKHNNQIAFVVGPRQVGKTTTSRQLRDGHYYFNWDNLDDRALILKGPKEIAGACNLDLLTKSKPLIIFDEIHKFSKWKVYLKGFYDTYKDGCNIVVTGSSRMDTYRRGGDSLMGRYFTYRMHPISLRESLEKNHLRDKEYTPPLKTGDDVFSKLLEFGGYPEPFLKGKQAFYRKWIRLRLDQLFKEDIRDLTRVQEIGQLEILGRLLIEQSGQLTNYTSLSKKVRVSVDTIRRWINVLNALYFCYKVKPWSKNISRSLIKEPKVYLWDWSLCTDRGARHENFIASHLLKSIHLWNDTGMGDYDLYFLRDKEKREVDFLITKDKTPWTMIEVKSAETSVSHSLMHFQKQLGVPHCFQVVIDLPYVGRDCFSLTGINIIPAKTFLSQLA